MRTLVLALAVCLGVLAAGCTGGASPAERSFATKGDGRISLGWAYDGAGVEPLDGFVQGMALRNADNTGKVESQFSHHNSTWQILFESFAQAEGKEFQDGGIAFDLDEHGDTGVADASIPRIHARVAAWGTAMVLREGVLVGGAPWAAHLMVSGDTVRGADGRITKADGATPYDPSTPADARRDEGDPQLLFFVKHPEGETFARPPVNETLLLTCEVPLCETSQELAIEAAPQELTFQFTILGPEAPSPVPLGALGQGRISISDASGLEVAALDVVPQPLGGGAPGTATIGDAGRLAYPLTATLTGEGSFRVALTATGAYDDLPFLVLTFDEVELS